MAVYKTKKQEDPWVRVFDVTEPTGHEKGYTIYKVISKVFPKNSFESVSQIIVWKRYNDFKVLHKALLTIHRNLHLKGKFPPFAKSTFFGRFEGEIIEERRKSALALLEFAAQYPPLFTSQIFVKFFEGGEKVRIQSELNSTLDPPLLPAKVTSSTPSKTSCPDISSEPSEIDTLLGGIWQHRKAIDDISLSSHPTEDELGEEEDDDDRTTFTDGSSTLSTPLPSSELAFFDPLPEVHITEEHTEVSNTWLLSAIEACSRLDHSISEDHGSPDPNSFSFPRPFDDGEEVESSSVTDIDVIPIKSQKEDNNISSSDFPTSHAVPSWKEFDPLTTNVTSSEFEADSQLKVTSPVEPPTLTPLSPIASNLDFIDRNNSKYLTNAAEEISCAQQCEAVGDFTHAFAFYKTAIATLLEGVQADKNTERRDAVRRKINQYLVRAEEIYNKYLAEKVQDHKRWAVDSRLSPATVLNTTINSLRAPFHELSKYKVLGAIRKVLLVLDTTNNSTYVIKSHHSPASDHHLRRGRPRRSSSTGSLELTLSQRVRHFSDVFQELDAAVTQAALDPPHLPESCVRQWIAELVSVVAELHKLGMVCQDLHPDNILLGERGHILLTYQCQWNRVDKPVNKHACDKLYAAPEVGSIFEVTSACDWWSVGALLFEMLTGRALYSCQSGGITSHTTINIPSHVSVEAQDLLRKLLKYSPSERLGAGPHGLDDIKSHPFFAKINWSSMET
ncbi:ribosomal protein S6 kinase delta-1-like isoform X2 [Limulus polyphemus]|uniref:Ribosomal protein S6 kinase delta-1-like isoform X2 n=1 Tax=Limulus polyphemus TaxID=6850 RepID=A0ABM1T0A6_LIMPO|nr:ribosomal protein S6 kinase delta-1-like isoform X2 [Limulus polyphemus]